MPLYCPSSPKFFEGGSLLSYCTVLAVLISFFQPPAVPTKKPLLFPNSGKNTKYYQYYNLEDSRNWSSEEPGDPGETGGPGDLEDPGTPTPPPHSTEDGSFFEYHSQLLLLSSLKRQLEDLKGGEFSDFKFSQIFKETK